MVHDHDFFTTYRDFFMTCYQLGTNSMEENANKLSEINETLKAIGARDGDYEYGKK